MSELILEAGEKDPFSLPTFGSERWEYCAQFDVERWYPQLAEHTFETTWVALERRAAEALRRRYRHRHLGGEAPGEEDGRLLDELEGRLDQEMAGRGWKQEGCFVRLSSRSPKDVGLERAARAMTPEELRTEGKGAEEINDAMRALMRACGESLRVANGREALELLGSSERVFTDLHREEEQAKLSGEWRCQVVCRRWEPVDPEAEWRCFVSRGVLVAAAQYNDQLCYPQLAGAPEAVDDAVARMQQLFAVVGPLVNHSYYVIDFALSANRCWVVELNPAGPVTGASLFNWTSDRRLLTPASSDHLATLSPMTIPYIEQRVIAGVVVRYRKLPAEGLAMYFEMMTSEALPTTQQLASSSSSQQSIVSSSSFSLQPMSSSSSSSSSHSNWCLIL